MEAVVAHHLELVEHAHLGVTAQLPGLVVDFFDVRFRARRGDDARAVAADAVEAFLAHLSRQHDDAVEAHAAAYPRPADAVVAGAGPDQRVLAGVHFTKELFFHQHRIGRADLVRARGKLLAIKDDNVCINAGQRFGQHLVIGRALLVLPGDVEQVDGIEGVVVFHAQRTRPDGRVNRARVQHFVERGAGNNRSRRHELPLLFL